MHGFKTCTSAKRSRFYSPDDGDTLIQLDDGSYAILGTPGYNALGEPVQYLTLPRGRAVAWKAAWSFGWVS